MKTRQGVEESKAFGPARPVGSRWFVTKADGTVVEAFGPTAFVACASLGLGLGEVRNIEAAAG